MTTIYDSAARLAKALARIDAREQHAIETARERAETDRKATIDAAEPEVVAVYAAAQKAARVLPAEVIDPGQPEDFEE